MTFKGRNIICLGCLLKAVYHLMHSGSLPCPRDSGDVHAPRQEEKIHGLGLCQLHHTITSLVVCEYVLREGQRLLKWGGGDRKAHPWKLVRAEPVYIESFIL